MSRENPVMKTLAAFAAAVLFSAMILAGTAARASSVPEIVVLGDSLVAGYGLQPGEAFPERLQEALAADGIEVSVTNAGVSGDTSSAGLARLDWSVPDGTDGVIVELGANDALRGIPPEVTRENLDMIVTRLKERGIAVLLAGMMAPPNMGEDYAAAFNPIYGELAEAHDIMLYPFFLDGVAAEAGLNQADGMHPTAEGVDMIVTRFMPAAKDFISKLAGENRAAAE
jgi:acyl-CoA thioesterase-1